MLKSSVRSAIRLRGVRHNNLKNFNLDLPLNQLIVITGLSGSGKSSLAFDTLFAEGQRRYIETFSPYARQFFDRMDKPQVDSIEGIPPAIAIEQRNAVKTTRSTVGTMTEICDYMKMLWPHVAQLHCRQCGRPVRKDSPQAIWSALSTQHATRNTDALITFDLPLTEKLSLDECLALVAKQGYQRVLLEGQVVRLEDVSSRDKGQESRLTHHASRFLTVVQDRVSLEASNRARFVEACEQAYHFGKGKLTIFELDSTQHASRIIQRFSSRLHCAPCDLEYREPSPALFSFNHPVGACPACRGFGRIISIDYDLALPDRSKTLAEGVVRPWQTGVSAECQTDLMRACRQHGVPTDVPFEKLPKKWQDFVVHGEPDYGKDDAHEWPSAWYGIKGYFRWLESKAYKMHVRVLLSRYRTYTPCPDCRGKRFQPEALLYRVKASELAGNTGTNQAHQTTARFSLSSAGGEGRGEEASSSMERGARPLVLQGLTLADFYQLPIRDALRFIENLAAKSPSGPNSPLALILNEVRSRLGYLDEVGLGYLTLDRPTRSLSGGETERVSLTTCLGTRLVNTLFVLDEPSVGLHPRDTERLVHVLQQLRSAGNTVVVVEHEASVMRAANQIVDLGPGHGATGGQVVFQGTYPEILRAAQSLTGQYLSGAKRIELPQRRPVKAGPNSRGSRSSRPANGTAALNDAVKPNGSVRSAQPALLLEHATRHNLKDLAVEIPLGRFVCITGVSGSGKTTLVREVLLPALAAQLKSNLSDDNSAGSSTAEENGDGEEPGFSNGANHSTQLRGSQHLGGVVLVDQSILAKTPRSNPAVYIGAFDDIREVFAQSEAARQRGLNASAFSFNSSQGQCERCRGAGFEKIEMQFLSDVFIRCPDCNGRRYRSHILEVTISPKSQVSSPEPVAARPSGRSSRSTLHAPRSLSIADLLDSTVDEAIEFLRGFTDSRPAQRARHSLELLQEVGLGYLKLGQPINTLSGGESQRLKLVRHLAECALVPAAARAASGPLPPEWTPKPNLFLFDEPTTGLHFEDTRVLLKVFQRLVDAGHSVLVIEHNLDVIKCADWLIDLGPDAGDQGGQIVAQGTPEDIAACSASHTGRALLSVFSPEQPKTRRIVFDAPAPKSGS